jgi:hypothetical protein
VPASVTVDGQTASELCKAITDAEAEFGTLLT